jgi:PAS domain S-box-containing protein
MEKSDKSTKNHTSVLQKAKELANNVNTDSKVKLTDAEIIILLHELEVHQMELEMQNKELINSALESQESSQKYNDLYDFAPSGYFTLSNYSEIIELNLSGANLIGKVRSDLVGKRFGLFVSHDTKLVFNNFMEKVFTSNVKHSCELTILNDKQFIYVHVTGVVNSNPDECLLTMVEITERKLAEINLAEKEVQYSNLANAGMALIWTSDTDKLCNYFNKPWLNFTGRTLEQELGNGWTEGVHPDDLKKCIDTYVKAFDKHKPFEMEYRIRHASGEYRWLLDIGNPNYDRNKNFIGYIGYCFDITNRKASQIKLAESEEKFRVLFQTMTQGVVYQKSDGSIISANPAAEKILGLSIDQMRGITSIDPKWNCIREDGASFPGEEHPAMQALNTGKAITNVVMGVLKTKTTSYTWINVNAVPQFQNGETKPYQVYTTFDDITDRFSFEKAKEVTERFQQQQLKFSEALNKIAEVIISNDYTDDILENVNSIIGETLKLDRILIYDIAFDRKRITGLCEWLGRSHADIEASKGEYPIDMFLSPLTEIRETEKPLASHFNNINEYFIKDGSGKILHERFKIKSLVWYPFAFHKNGYYLFTLNQIIKPRIWTIEEFDFLESVAKQVNLALIKIRLIQDRQLTQKFLKDSEERYRSLFDNMLNGFAHCQMFYDNAGIPVDYYHIAVNRAFLAQTGLKDVVGKKISEVIPGIRQADDELFKIYGRVAMSGVAEHFEMFVSSLDKWFAISVYSPLKDQFVVIFDNITLRKNTEEALRDNEKKYRLIAENTADVIWSMDLNLNSTFVSPSVFKLRGFTADEAMKQSAEQYLTPDSLKKMHKIFETQIMRLKDNLHLENNFIIEEFEQYKKDGSIILTENTISIIYNENKKPVGILGITRDITKRKQFEISLRESEEQFRAVTESANDAIITINDKGIVLKWNKGAEKIFGFTEQEIIKKELSTIMPKQFEVLHKAGIVRINQGGDRHVIGKTVELIGLNKNGVKFPVELSLAEWETSSGRFITGIIRDITQRKKAELEIELKNQELQKINVEKDKFFSIISHDLRAPFNGFLGLSQLIAEKSSSLTIDEIQEIAENMRKSAVNLFRLLENLLQWARIQQGALPFNPMMFKLRPLVNDCMANIIETAKTKEIELTCDIPDDLEVFADVNMLETVIRNLVSNAMKFTPRHGTINVKAHTNINKNVEITITDSGIGMSSEIVANLFRIDVKTNRLGIDSEPSTGLGLLLCKEFVEKHGGKIRVESKEANLSSDNTGGSVFSFTIPCNTKIEKETELNSIVSVKEQNPINNLKILIAEDDEVSEKLISRVVKSFSREILIAKTGVEAVEACRNNPDIELVLMDIKMPEMDGYEATRQIRLFNKDLVIIAQTAYAMSSARELAMQAGCNDYMPKPINHLLLADLIKKHFE